VEMLDAPTGHVRWAQTFGRTLKGVFKAEEEIAQAVTRVLQTTLAPSASGRLVLLCYKIDTSIGHIRRCANVREE